MILAAVGVLCSCGESETPGSGESGEAPLYIRFAATTTGSRASITDNSTFTRFSMFGYDSGSAESTPYVSGGGTSVGAVYTKSGNDWTGQSFVWLSPSQSLSFYGISPSHADVTSPVFNKSSQTFSLTLPPTVSEQTDVVAAIARDVTCGTDTVYLTFRHVASFNRFQLLQNINVDGLRITVRKLVIHNLRKTGTFTYSTTLSNSADASATRGGMGSWSVSDDDGYADYVITPSSPIELVYGEKVEITDGSGGVLQVIPQTATAWRFDSSTRKPTETISEADAAHRCYMEAECCIEVNGIYSFSSSDHYGSVYKPMWWDDGELFPNAVGTWWFNFDGWFNAEGKNVLNVGGFTVLDPVEAKPNEDWGLSVEEIEL